jgi:hypothetical protein
MKKILPFDLDVPLNAFPFYGNYFAILKGHRHDVTPIMINHYIQIRHGFPFTDMIDYTGWFFCGASTVRKLFCIEPSPKHLDDPLDYLKTSIDENKYVTLLLNHKYLSFDQCDVDYYHDYMVIGYDDSFSVMYVVGYWIKKQGLPIYSVHEIAYSDIIKAVPQKGKKTMGLFSYSRDFRYRFHYRCWLPEHFKVEPIDIRRLKRSIFLYAYKIRPWSFNTRTYTTCRLTAQYFNKGKYDARFLKVIEEHAKLLYQLIIYYTDEGSELAKSYHEVVRKTKQMLLLTVKARLQPERCATLYSRISHLLIEVKKLEEDIMKCFYKDVVRKL